MPGRTREDKLQQKLADYVEDAHAMEQNDLKMLDSMISTTDDPQMREMIENHRKETEQHERRLRERLNALGRGTSVRKQAQAVGAALLKSVGDQARGDQVGKNARDGYMAEHMEIAAYQLLERLAEKAGDTETAEVARLNRADEEEMARRIDQSWDRSVELTLEENNISAGPVSGRHGHGGRGHRFGRRDRRRDHGHGEGSHGQPVGGPREAAALGEGTYYRDKKGRDTMLRPSLSCPYSPECVEGGFCELRLDEVLGSSWLPQ